jgi:hypothetical protein
MACRTAGRPPHQQPPAPSWRKPEPLTTLGAGKSLKGHLQAIRGQICVRIHENEIEAAALLAIGN